MGILDKIKKTIKREKPKEEEKVFNWSEVDESEHPDWFIKFKNANPGQIIRYVTTDDGYKSVEIECLPEMLKWPAPMRNMLNAQSRIYFTSQGHTGECELRMKPLDREIQSKMDLLYELKRINMHCWLTATTGAPIKIWDSSKNCYMSQDTIKHYGKEEWLKFIESDDCKIVLQKDMGGIQSFKMPKGFDCKKDGEDYNLICVEGALRGKLDMPVVLEGEGMLAGIEPDEIILTPEEEKEMADMIGRVPRYFIIDWVLSGRDSQALYEEKCKQDPTLRERDERLRKELERKRAEIRIEHNKKMLEIWNDANESREKVKEEREYLRRESKRKLKEFRDVLDIDDDVIMAEVRLIESRQKYEDTINEFFEWYDNLSKKIALIKDATTETENLGMEIDNETSSVDENNVEQGFGVRM